MVKETTHRLRPDTDVTTDQKAGKHKEGEGRAQQENGKRTSSRSAPPTPIIFQGSQCPPRTAGQEMTMVAMKKKD